MNKTVLTIDMLENLPDAQQNLTEDGALTLYGYFQDSSDGDDDDLSLEWFRVRVGMPLEKVAEEIDIDFKDENWQHIVYALNPTKYEPEY